MNFKQCPRGMSRTHGTDGREEGWKEGVHLKDRHSIPLPCIHTCVQSVQRLTFAFLSRVLFENTREEYVHCVHTARYF